MILGYHYFWKQPNSLSNQNQKPSYWDVSPLAFLATTSTFALATSRARATQCITTTHRKFHTPMSYVNLRKWGQTKTLKCISRNCGWLFFWGGCLHRRCIYIYIYIYTIFKKGVYELWTSWVNDSIPMLQDYKPHFAFIWSYNLLENNWSTWTWNKNKVVIF